MTTTLIHLVPVSSVLADLHVPRRARRVLADHDLLVGEFLDEELRLVEFRWELTRHDPELRGVAIEVAARHRDAFWVPVEADTIEDRLLADLLDPEQPRLALHHGDDPDPSHVFAPRDRMVLHDEVDLSMGLHIVACRSHERARHVLADLLTRSGWSLRTVGDPDLFGDLLAADSSKELR